MKIYNVASDGHLSKIAVVNLHYKPEMGDGVTPMFGTLLKLAAYRTETFGRSFLENLKALMPN